MAHHDHDHHHHDRHHHAPARFGTAFAIGTALNLGFALVEIGVGFYANSLALISDAMHNFSDVVCLLLAWGAAWLCTRAPTASRTYGYRRASILAALANAALLFAATGAILTEAVQRLLAPQPIAAATVLWVAALGIVINTGTALMFMRDRARDLNLRGAFLHMVGDAIVSVGVVVAALLIGWTGRLWLDPAVSIAIAVVILVATWSLTRDALNLALDAVPAGIDRHAVEAYLAGLPGVTEVHDLHIWAMSTTETALTAHLVRPNAGLDDHLLTDAAHELDRRFGIRHATMQVEAGLAECRLAPAHVV
ncbi:MAG TPA: cation diffusion facilitator family transporter [Xanthobacteraceae bacterium]|nr:cation diffusion facilitator family transporter [Xanthobacteraceae bacterium]